MGTDDHKRQLFVAITRAKKHLAIYLNGYYLDDIAVEQMERLEDPAEYQPLDRVAMHPSATRTWRSIFSSIGRTRYVLTAAAADPLTLQAMSNAEILQGLLVLCNFEAVLSKNFGERGQGLRAGELTRS